MLSRKRPYPAGWYRLTKTRGQVYVIGEANDTHVLVSNYRGLKTATLKKSDLERPKEAGDDNG